LKKSFDSGRRQDYWPRGRENQVGRQGDAQMSVRAHLVPVIFALAACASTPDAPATSWGKPGVTLTQFWTDSSECALAGAATQVGTASNLEGVGNPADGARPAAGASALGTPNSLRPVGNHGSEVDTNMYDVAARAQYNAAVAQRNADEAQKAAVEGCLVERGYRRFRLNAEQSAHLATLPTGSAERRAYLHQLASDPAVQAAQAL
jgi:hypothetical protein